MPRKMIGWDWEPLPPLPRCRDRLNGCLNENGRPKIRWPNQATALWYREHLPRKSIKPCEPYECPTCGTWHLGRPKQPLSKMGRARTLRKVRGGAMIGVMFAAHRSMVDAPAAE